MTENYIQELCCVYCNTLFFGIHEKERDDICFDCLARLESVDGGIMTKWLEVSLDDWLDKKLKKESDEECT